MISEEDIIKIKKFIDIRNRGYYCSGQDVTDVYNRVLNKNMHPSNCASCIRQRINELEVVLKEYEKAQNALKNDEPNTTNEDKNKATGEAENKPIRKVGRPSKKK